MEASNISGAAHMVQQHMHTTFANLGHALYRPVFYYPILLNFCDFNSAEIFLCGSRRDEGDEAAWASFTVHTLSVYVLVCIRLEDLWQRLHAGILREIITRSLLSHNAPSLGIKMHIVQFKTCFFISLCT
jgi:hypothetical protein